jgi:hypothetical protein
MKRKEAMAMDRGEARMSSSTGMPQTLCSLELECSGWEGDLKAVKRRTARVP